MAVLSLALLAAVLAARPAPIVERTVIPATAFVGP
jgi:hypothetical protein